MTECECIVSRQGNDDLHLVKCPLCAAAPEMLETLRWLIDRGQSHSAYCNKGYPCTADCFHPRIVAAIAKAEGREKRERWLK